MRLVLPAPLRPMTSSRSPRPTVERDVGEDRRAAVALGQAVDGEHDRARRAAGPGSGTSMRFSRFGPVTFDVFSLRDAVCRAPWRSCARFELWPRIVSASWRSRSISAPCRVASLASRSSSAARAVDVLRVRALVLGELAVVEVQHARDRRVEQLEVVADDEQRAAVRAQEADEPLLGVVVEVVGRLVEQQQVAAREEDARELDPAALATGQRVDGEVEPAVGEAEAGRDAAHLRLGRVAARVAELLLGARELGDVALGRVLLDAEAQLLDPLRGDVEPAPGEHVREAGVVDAGAAGRRVLGEVAEGVGAQRPRRRRPRPRRR